MVGRLVHLHVGRRRQTGAETVSVCSRRLITLYPVYCTTCPGHSMNPTVCVSLLSISRADCRVPCPGGDCHCALRNNNKPGVPANAWPAPPAPGGTPP